MFASNFELSFDAPVASTSLNLLNISAQSGVLNGTLVTKSPFPSVRTLALAEGIALNLWSNNITVDDLVVAGASARVVSDAACVRCNSMTLRKTWSAVAPSIATVLKLSGPALKLDCGTGAAACSGSVNIDTSGSAFTLTLLMCLQRTSTSQVRWPQPAP